VGKGSVGSRGKHRRKVKRHKFKKRRRLMRHRKKSRGGRR
jgi:hypothetical protein